MDYHQADAPTANLRRVQRGMKIGNFPVAAMRPPLEAPSFVHLSRIFAVDRQLFVTPVASLSAAAVHLLRFKLAECLATRNVSLLSELEAAIGQSITSVRTVRQRSGTSAVAITLARAVDRVVSSGHNRSAGSRRGHRWR
jgi:hypothetical protein